MNLNSAKMMIRDLVGKRKCFLYRGARNQNEKFNGVIIKCFSSIFLIETDDGFIKSFSYNDFIINNIKIIS